MVTRPDRRASLMMRLMRSRLVESASAISAWVRPSMKYSQTTRTAICSSESAGDAAEAALICAIAVPPFPN